MAIEDAGYTRASLQIPNGRRSAGQVGVYVGVMYGEYQLFGAEASLQGNRMGFASNLASIANRVSYVLNLHGPSMALDTMCSSSLTAIHLACQDLKLGRTSLAIAGGVNVTIHPNKYLMLSAGPVHFQRRPLPELRRGRRRVYPGRRRRRRRAEAAFRGASATATTSTGSSRAARSTTAARPTATRCPTRRRRPARSGRRWRKPGSTRAMSATSKPTARAPSSATRSRSRR